MKIKGTANPKELVKMAIAFTTNYKENENYEGWDDPDFPYLEYNGGIASYGSFLVLPREIVLGMTDLSVDAHLLIGGHRYGRPDQAAFCFDRNDIEAFSNFCFASGDTAFVFADSLENDKLVMCSGGSGYVDAVENLLAKCAAIPDGFRIPLRDVEEYVQEFGLDSEKTWSVALKEDYFADFLAMKEKEIFDSMLTPTAPNRKSKAL